MRTSRLFTFAAVAALFIGCGQGDRAATEDALDASAVDPGNAGGNKLVKVLTRNLYIGADVTPFIKGEAGSSPGDLWETIQATDYPKRSGALADEIAAARPDVVGLQEAYRFVVTMVQGGAPVWSTTIDYLDILLAQLAARGTPYRAVVAATRLDLPVPLSPDVVIGVTDRDAILVRDDLEAANGVAHAFTYLAPLPAAFGGGQVPRGWTEVDVKARGSWFHFVNAHLEIGDTPELAYLQYLQAMELVGSLPAGGPTILVGDFNGDANASSATYAALASALSEAAPAGAPATCCQLERLDNVASVLDERVDLVFFRGPVTAEGAALVGAAPAFAESAGAPYWASDHAGVLATLRVWDPDAWALR
jgi:endonuclease/exonuclease/phosphatase family metal-dependent hydrolase